MWLLRWKKDEAYVLFFISDRLNSFGLIRSRWVSMVKLISIENIHVLNYSVVSTLCNSMDYTIHGILQARILEWVAFPFFRGSSQTRDQTQVSCIVGGFFTS